MKQREIYRYDPKDLDNDQAIGIQLPINNSKTSFNLSYTTRDQARTNIKNLLLTMKGERYMLPDFGTNIRKFLFENMSDDLLDDLRIEVINDINKWVKGIEIVDLMLYNKDWAESYNSRMEYHTIYFELTYNVLPNFGLERIRFFSDTTGVSVLEENNGIS